MASMSRFFYDAPLNAHQTVSPDEVTAKHVLQVLRMGVGDKIQLTNGKGIVATAVITVAEKKKCSVFIEDMTTEPYPQPALHLAIAFTKNTSRNEWLLEKATELGVSSIFPLIAKRSERERIRHDRWKNILISAMLQSQQAHLPYLAEAISLEQLLADHASTAQKLVGHCVENIERQALSKALQPGSDSLILIGPEGDFTNEEIELCLSAGCVGISMGHTRLRTETAAMAACAYFNMINYEKA